MDRRLEKGKATRDSLIVAARELFGQDGYEGTSVEAVLKSASVARGALYHHFATKEALFDAVLDREVGAIAEQAAGAARSAGDPLESLRAGCGTWLRVALDPAVQRITLVDAPGVVGWSRWREIDEQHTLGSLRATIRRIGRDGRIAVDQVDILANMVLAAVSEAAMIIARADVPAAALRSGLAALDTLLDRLFGT